MELRQHEFDEATVVERTAEHSWTGEIHDGWDVASVANGGYVMAVAVNALLEYSGRPDPLSVTAHFLAPATSGKVEIDVSPVRTGGRTTTATARMVQNDVDLVRIIGVFGSLEKQADAPFYSGGEGPILPPLEECVRPMPMGDFRPPPITDKVTLAIDPLTAGFAVKQPSGTAEMRGWSRFADGREPDTLSLPLFADAFPPPIFNAGLPINWVPTLELTVQIRKRPASGWLGSSFRTRLARDGFLDEEGEVYDSENDLVALSRQLALAPRAR